MNTAKHVSRVEWAARRLRLFCEEMDFGSTKYSDASAILDALEEWIFDHREELDAMQGAKTLKPLGVLPRNVYPPADKQ